MVRQPAQEEGQNESCHDLKRFVGLCHLGGSQSEDDDGITNNNEDEWDHKSKNKAAHSYDFMAVLARRVVVNASVCAQVILDITVYHRRDT